MSDIAIDIKGLIELQQRISNMPQRMIDGLDGMLDSAANNISTKAKQLAPFDEGNLAGNIAPDISRLLEKHITSGSNYSAFVEFGTGKYAAAYVSSLPETWAQYAATFRGQSGGGTFDEMILAIFEWIKRHGLRLQPGQFEQGDTFSRGKLSKPKNVKKQTIEEGQQQLAYLIARKIMRDGIKQQPFMFPAYEEERPKILKNAETILNEL